MPGEGRGGGGRCPPLAEACCRPRRLCLRGGTPTGMTISFTLANNWIAKQGRVYISIQFLGVVLHLAFALRVVICRFCLTKGVF